MPSRAATFTLRKSPLRCDLLSSKYGATVKMAGCEWMYSPHSKLTPHPDRKKTGKMSSNRVSLLLLARAAALASTGVAIGLTCESFSQKAVELTSVDHGN